MDSREKDKALEGLLRQTLASQTHLSGDGANEQCPSAEILAAYYERSLSPNESAACDTHFSQCASCRDSLAAMVRAEEVPAPASKWTWLFNPYWLAPAIAGLALVMLFVIRHPSQTAKNSPDAKAPLIAQSEQNETPPAPAPQSAPELRDAAPAVPAVPARQGQEARTDARERDALALQPSTESPAAVDESKAKSVNQSVEVTAAPKANQNETTPAPVPNAVSSTSVQNLPLNGRNIMQLNQLKAANAPQALAKDKEAQKQSLDDAKKTPGTAAAGAATVTTESAAAVNALPTAPKPQSNTGAVTSSAPTLKTDSAVVGGIVQQNQAQAPPEMRRYEAVAPAAGAPGAKFEAPISSQKIIETPNSKVRWRSADGFVERSIDGGANWFGQQLPGTSGEIQDGSSPNAKVCWLVGTSGTIYVTKDATNWRKIPPPGNVDLTAVDAKDGNTATITTADGRRFQTTTAGMTWKPLN